VQRHGEEPLNVDWLLAGGSLVESFFLDEGMRDLAGTHVKMDRGSLVGFDPVAAKQHNGQDGVRLAFLGFLPVNFLLPIERIVGPSLREE
jgi:hypothetical protein